MEDYLETIANINDKKDVARVRDISRLMDVKKSTVTEALNNLASKNLVIHERYGYVELKTEGKKIAEEIQIRHRTLSKFLTNILKVDSKTAGEDACKMEHVVSKQTFTKIVKFIDFVETCPNDGKPDWLNSYEYFSDKGERPECKHKENKK